MNKLLQFGILFALLALLALAVSGYRSQQRGKQLYQTYFNATPVNGYGQLRAFGAVSATDASILRQGVAYHQQAEYDLALMSLRAYLDGNPVPDDDEVWVLAATAAMATGEYAEAGDYLEALSVEGGELAAADAWYEVMLSFQEEDIQTAAAHLRAKQAIISKYGYPVEAVLSAL